MHNQKPLLGELPDWTRFPRPVGLWLMNEGGGSRVNDLSGNGNTGTHTGATWVAGNSCPAVNYDGNDYTNCGNGPSLNWGASDFTVIMGVKIDAVNDGQLFASDASGAIAWQCKMLSNGDIYFRVNDGVNSAAQDTRTTPLADLNWHSLAFRVNHNSATGLQFFVDGIVEARTANPTAVGSLDNASEFGIATRNPNDNGDYGSFKLSYLSIYNRSLSSSQIAYLCRNRFPWFVEDEVSHLYVPGGPPTVKPWWYYQQMQSLMRRTG